MLRILFAVVLSGAASLVYQVAWTRRLSDVTTATAHSQALVLAVFFAGLGIGAVYPGRLASRARRPLLGYALVEAGALAAALASIPAFDAFDALRSALSRAGAAPSTALTIELVVAGAFLLVPAMLMGASLPFVLEHAQRTMGEAARGRLVPLVYAVNTVGAALGCGFAGYVLVERIGLARTTAAGAALSLVAALVAVSRSRATPAPSPAEKPDDDAPALGIPRPILAAGALAGFIGVGAEVVWTRLFSLVVLNTVYVFTEVLVAVLLGIAAGSVLVRFIAPRAERFGLLRATGLAQTGAAIAIACVGPLSLLLAGRTDLEGAIATGRSPLGALVVVLALAIPVALNAATLPLLVQAVASARVSRSFGAIYAANTAGSVAGSLLCGFVLIPRLGTSGASGVLEAASLVLAGGLFWMGSEKKSEAVAALFPGVVIVLLHWQFGDVARRIYEARVPPHTHVLELCEGVTSDVMVTEAESGQRRLWINSSWVAGTGGGHKALGHLPALFVPTPRRVVGIALGTGQTFAAVFANGVTELHVVELNPDVVRLSRLWFAEANDHLFERPGVVVHEDDGRAFLRSRRDRFELIVLEPLQAWSRGTSSLYSREFYEEAKGVLAPSGVVAQWIPFYGQGLEDTRAMVRTALEVFPQATLWLDEHDGILLLHGGPIALPPAEMEARIHSRRIAADLRSKSIEGAADVLSMLVLGPEGLARWARGAPLITDDRPFLEFRAARALGEDSFEPIIASIARSRDGAPPESAVVAGGPVPAAIEGDTASRALLADALAPSGALSVRASMLEQAMIGAPHVTLLRVRYRHVIETWAARESRTAGKHLEEILLRGVAHDDDYGEAMLNLAVLAVRRNDRTAARSHLERAIRVERVKARATQMLAELTAP